MASPEGAALEAAKAAGDYAQVAFLLSKMELGAGALGAWPWGLQLLACIHSDDLEGARFTWKRVPEAAQAQPELKAIFRLLQLHWNAEYPEIWSAISAFSWSQDLRPVIDSLAEKTRKKMMGLVEKAYTTIGVDKLAALLGQSKAEATAAAAAAGWQQDAADGMIKVVPAVDEAAAMVDHEKLQEVATLVAHLSSES